jgi:phenylpropionate dioxygenase-like ring-hydroxylating dioxygenase large terminal subunit
MLLSQVDSSDAIAEQVIATANLPLPQGKALPPKAYTDPAYYGLEVEKILKREWLSVGHVAQLPRAGDYFNLELLGEPMVVVRGKDDVIRVLSRVCPHRGMDVNPTEYGRPAAGNARFLVCPYHFWTYDLDGRCKGAPEMQLAEGFSRKETGLAGFRTEVWHGLIFVTFSPDIPPVAEFYKDLGEKLAQFQMDKLEMVADITWDSAFNWKVIVENFAECYHHLGSHIKTFEPLFPAKTCWSEPEHPSFTVAHLPMVPDLAEQVRAGKSPVQSFMNIPTVEEENLTKWFVFVGYPTLLLFIASDRLYWYRVLPEGPGKVTLLTTLLIWPDSKNRPDYEQKLKQEIDLLRTFHLEDMEACVAVQKGMNSGSYRPGRLSHLEKPIWHIQRYLARKLQEAMPDVATGAVPYSPECDSCNA